MASSEVKHVSVMFFGFCFSVGGAMAALGYAVFGLGQAHFSWTGIGLPIINSMIIGLPIGLLYGLLWRIILVPTASKPFAAVMVVLTFALCYAIGVFSVKLTATHGGTLIWHWAR